MRTVRYCLHGFFVLIRERLVFHITCFIISAVIFAAIPFLFSNSMMTWAENSWHNRVAKVTFCEDVSARAIHEQLSDDPRVNGYLMNLDVQQQGGEYNLVTVNAVRGVLYDRNLGDNALLGSADSSDEDVYLLRQMDIQGEYRFRMDEMTVLIDGQPFHSAGISNPIGSNYDDLPSLGKGLTVFRMAEDGEAALFESQIPTWSTLVLIPAATAAKHDYPVSALEISFTELDAAAAFQDMIAPFAEQVARVSVPWSDEPLKPSFDQLPQDSLLNLLSEVVCLLNIMVLLLLWLGTFQGAIRIWLREGASGRRCGLALFILGLLMLVLSMALGYGLYALLLPPGIRLGLFAALPLNILSLIGTIFFTVALICLIIYCRRCIRTAAQKGA